MNHLEAIHTLTLSFLKTFLMISPIYALVSEMVSYEVFQLILCISYCPMHATHPNHLVLLDLVILIKLHEEK